MYWSNQRRSLRAVKKGNFDVFHPTYYDPYFLEAIGERPFYLEVHDMIHEVYPQYFPGHTKIPTWKRALVESADRIVTVSDSTRKDLIKILSVDPKRVKTIHQGISLDPGQSQIQDLPSWAAI